MAGEEPGAFAEAMLDSDTDASMRPRLGGRGRGKSARMPAHYARAASMRPRLGGRGRVSVSSSIPACRRSFNEAPARWPGKRSWPPPRTRSSRRFNEAPARWPGKRARRPCRLRRPAPAGFNEAPARWPGKSGAVHRKRQAHRIASMRPRLGGRGRDANGLRVFATMDVASMRPRLGGRGRVHASEQRREHAQDASMRPRLGGRGRALRVEAGEAGRKPLQ